MFWGSAHASLHLGTQAGSHYLRVCFGGEPTHYFIRETKNRGAQAGAHYENESESGSGTIKCGSKKGHSNCKNPRQLTTVSGNLKMRVKNGHCYGGLPNLEHIISRLLDKYNSPHFGENPIAVPLFYAHLQISRNRGQLSCIFAISVTYLRSTFYSAPQLSPPCTL